MNTQEQIEEFLMARLMPSSARHEIERSTVIRCCELTCRRVVQHFRLIPPPKPWKICRHSPILARCRDLCMAFRSSRLPHAPNASLSRRAH